MKISLLLLVLAIFSAPNPALASSLAALEADLANYSSLSDRLTHHLNRIEANANRCWKEQSHRYQLAIKAAGFYSNLDDARASLAANKILVQQEFNSLLVSAGLKSREAEPSAYARGTAKLLRRKLAELERKLRTNQAKVADPKVEGKISIVIQCGDPEILPNKKAMATFKEAVKDYNSLVHVHQKLRKFMDSNEEKFSESEKGQRNSSVATAY